MNTLPPSSLSDGTTSYLGQLAHIPLLTREGEVEIAKWMEACEQEVLAALGHCKAGRDVIAELSASVNRGDLRVRDIVRGFDEDDADWEDRERRKDTE